MEFLVEFEVDVRGTPSRGSREGGTVAATKLADEAISYGVWMRPLSTGEANVLGLYRAESESELDGLLSALPLYDWMTRHRHPARAPSQRPSGRAGGSEPVMSDHAAQAAAEPRLPIGGTAWANRSISVRPPAAGAASCP